MDQWLMITIGVCIAASVLLLMFWIFLLVLLRSIRNELRYHNNLSSVKEWMKVKNDKKEYKHALKYFINERIENNIIPDLSKKEGGEIKSFFSD